MKIFQTSRQKTISLILTLLALIILYLITQNIPEENVRLFLARTGIFAPLVYVFLVWATHALPPISSAPFAFAGFYVFGPNVVFLITFAASISYITNFLVARKWGRPLVIKFVGIENTKRVDQLTQNYGIGTLIVLRIFMAGAHDFISYAVGLTSFKFLPYILVSFLTLIPGTALWYYLALKMPNPLAFTALNFALGAFFAGLFVLFKLASSAWKKIKQK